MWEVALQQKLWTPDQPKDFTATFSDGEYSHKYYSGRRMWGVFRLLSPSAQLPSEYGNLKTDKPYPFSVKVDKPVSPLGCMAVLRDWYNDSQYSTSVGVGAGAFGTPDRYSTSAADYSVTGNWERTIALYRTSDSVVVQSRSWLPDEVGGVIWFGPHSATATAYVPIVMGMTRVPECLSSGWQGVFNLTQSFWVHRVVENLAQIKFSYMIQDIRDLQSSLESASQSLVDSVSALVSQSATTLRGGRTAVDYDTIFADNAQKARDSFSQLANDLLFKYADGYINRWVGNKFTSTSAGYPVDWLDQDSVGYTTGPPPPPVDAKVQQ